MTLRLRAALCWRPAFAACGGAEQKPPTVGELKDFAAVCDKAHEGRRVAVVGYLRFPEKFSGDRSVMLRIYQAADFAGQPVGVQTMIGKQPNQAEAPPRQFADKDLKVYLADRRRRWDEGRSTAIYITRRSAGFSVSLSNR